MYLSTIVPILPVIFLLRLAYPYPGKSTRYQLLFIIKWFISSVFPGFDDVSARFLRPHSMLIRLLLPTLLRPMNAYSGSLSLGQRDTSLLLITKSDVITRFLFESLGICVVSVVMRKMLSRMLILHAKL